MEQERDDQVIYFKDLIFAALYQWRKIILTALILAVLFGGFQLLRTAFSGSASSEESSSDQEQITFLEASVADIDKQIQQQKSYLEDSILMSVDPYLIYRSAVTVYVSTDYQILPEMTYQNPDRTSVILQSYQRLLMDTGMLSDAADSLGIPVRYLAELLQFDTTSISSGIMIITVSYTDSEGAEQIAQQLTASLNQLKSQIEESIQPHELIVLDSNMGVQVDTTVLDKQKAAEQRLTDLQTSRKAIEAELQALRTPISQEKVRRSPVFFAIVGGVIGAFLAMCLAWISHMASGKVYSQRTLRNRTGVKLLGCAPAPGKKNPIDQCIRRLEGRSTSPDQTGVIAAVVKNCYQGTQMLMIAGDSSTQSREPLVSALKAIGVPVCDCGSLTAGTEALEALPKCDGVLLVERCGKSKYDDVSKAMERIQDQEKQLVGCVLLDG